MKTAKKIVCTVELICPECGEPIPSPLGSLYWTVTEIEIHKPGYVPCPACGVNVRLPKGVK